MTAPSFERGVLGSAMPIAGVPWPLYKLVALAVGLLVLMIVAVITMDPGPAVVAAAAAATAVWLGSSLLHSSNA